MYSVNVIIVIFVVFTCGGLCWSAEAGDLNWWKRAVFYQIYPRSFKDSNNDGIGDLQGIMDKLDHIKDAGIDAVWISPIFKSPQADMGYDISDYRTVDPMFGSNENLTSLLKKAKGLGIKVFMDFVPNHSSNQHEWFVKSEQKVKPYTDYYVWADGSEDDEGNKVPPNNWISIFQGSAWTWSEKRQQWYLHQFLPQQPDLNYRSEHLKAEMADIMRFWLDAGVDGFRVDAVPYLIEDKQLRDEPLPDIPVTFNESDYNYLKHNLTKDQPGTYDVIYYFRKVLDNYTSVNGGDARIMMTEAYSTINETMYYYGTPDGKKLGAHFTFNFNFIPITNESSSSDFASAINLWLDNIPNIYTSNWVMGNHDNHRVATRVGPANVDGMNMLMALLPGIGVFYNGEEIGQENGEVTFDQKQDNSANDPRTFAAVSRDFERTPFQWDNTTNAGFNAGHKPWLPVSKKYKETNLAAQSTGEKSHYSIFKELLRLRKNNSAAISGNTEAHSFDNVVVVKRALDKDFLLITFNIKDGKQSIHLTDVVDVSEVEVAVSSLKSSYKKGDRISTSKALSLEGHEALVLITAPNSVSVILANGLLMTLMIFIRSMF